LTYVRKKERRQIRNTSARKKKRKVNHGRSDALGEQNINGPTWSQKVGIGVGEDRLEKRGKIIGGLLPYAAPNCIHQVRWTGCPGTKGKASPCLRKSRHIPYNKRSKRQESLQKQCSFLALSGTQGIIKPLKRTRPNQKATTSAGKRL